MKKTYQCFCQRIKKKCPYEALVTLQAAITQLKADLSYISRAQDNLEQALQGSQSMLKKACKQPYLDGYTWQTEQIVVKASPNSVKQPQKCPYTVATCANTAQVLAMRLRGMRRQKMNQLARYNTLLAMSKGYMQGSREIIERGSWLSYGLEPEPYLMAIVPGSQKDDEILLLWGEQASLSYRQYTLTLQVEGVADFLEGMYYVSRGKQVLILPTLPSDVPLKYEVLDAYCWKWLKRKNKRFRQKVEAFGIYLPQVLVEKEKVIKQLYTLGYQMKGKIQEDGQYLSEVVAIKWLS